MREGLLMLVIVAVVIYIYVVFKKTLIDGVWTQLRNKFSTAVIAGWLTALMPPLLSCDMCYNLRSCRQVKCRRSSDSVPIAANYVFAKILTRC